MNISFAQPIGIFGGTFDPVHLGHLGIAHEIQQSYHLAKIYWVPCGQPVHYRPSPLATPQQRLAMLTYAVKDEPTFYVDDCEIRRHKPSYMVDTLEMFRDQFPTAPLCLILGIDAWLGFTEWHRYKTIIDLSHLIIAQRPSYELPKEGKIANLLQQHLTQDVSALYTSLGGYIFYYHATSLNISATAIRNKIINNEYPQALLPASVYDYIIREGIYLKNKNTPT